ncbi:MAG: protein-methionine-sulfoxide reductase catalytic subunit MsrP [Myxococcota bacterium]
MLIKKRHAWEMSEHQATPESVYLNRRSLLKALGLGGIGLGSAARGLLTSGAVGGGILGATGCNSADAGLIDGGDPTLPAYKESPLKFPVKRNEKYTLDRPLTDERVAARYNNFYEFTTDKERVWKLTEKYVARPWSLEVGGLVQKPKTFDLDDLLKRMPMEERIYRFRCVEAWAMAVPWTGFPLAALLKEVEPTSEARYVRMTAFMKPEEAPGQANQPWYPWPYYEGLSLPEAMNELTLIAVGIYGHILPKQHGAPLRLVVPWKYGFKSIKGIVKIELTAQEPPTFWHKLQPEEYSFHANVEPTVPHPRWSQATERMIGTGERRPTQLYNGYGEQVAALYKT